MKETKQEGPPKRIGWFCSFVPEELILASGLESVRLEGRADNVEGADTLLSSNLCPFLKNVIASAVGQEYRELAGVVFTNSCDGMRRVYDLWTQVGGAPPAFMLEVPKTRTDEAVAYFAQSLLVLKTFLERSARSEISDESLRRAIRLVNEKRHWVKAIFDGQKETPPRNPGSEVLKLLREESSKPASTATIRLRGLRERPTRLMDQPAGPRILVLGNRLDRGLLLERIEAAGASVVLFDTCNGLAHYVGQVDESLEPAEALARRYLLKPSCARMPGVEQRLARLDTLLQDYWIQGVIYNSGKFCDYSLFETPQIEEFLKKKGVPFLVLETDYLFGDVERLRTRVEAFIELAETV